MDTRNRWEAYMQVRVKKWGNSASVRIPVALMEAARLELDDAVEIREERGKIIIEPLERAAYDLDRLVAGITPANRHEEIPFGAPVGRELL
jgi:antitoxin MazE